MYHKAPNGSDDGAYESEFTVDEVESNNPIQQHFRSPDQPAAVIESFEQEADEGNRNFDFSRVLISGAGFLADAYDLFVINIAVDLMERGSVNNEYHEPLTKELKSTIKSMALAGAVVGQIGFGCIADLIGRKKVFIATCALVTMGALLSATAINSHLKDFGIFSQICLYRFVLGVGVGGEYPLSATVTSESSHSQDQIVNLSMVFSMQGAGTLLCAIVLVVVTSTLDDAYSEVQWRLVLALGALPMMIAFYFRWRMHEEEWKLTPPPPPPPTPTPTEHLQLADVSTAPSTMHLRHQQQQMQVDYSAESSNSATISHESGSSSRSRSGESESTSSSRKTQNWNEHDELSNSDNANNNDSTYRGEEEEEERSSRKCSSSSLLAYFQMGWQFLLHTVYVNRWALLGTAGAWFILDIVFYANGLFSGQVTRAMGFADSPHQEAVAALILQAVALPGYICTIFYVERIGLKRLQLISFIATAIAFLLLAVLQPYLVEAPVVYVLLYGATFFCQNFGANPTTYIIPSLLYSSQYRATCHGISAAAGKLGALLGAQVFLYLADSFCAADNCSEQSSVEDINTGLQVTFLVCGLLSVFGWAWTNWLIPLDQTYLTHRIN